MNENSRLSLNWNLNRKISKLNYRIHTDAIKTNLIPPELTPEQISFTYASEADLLSVALFGKTARQWRDENADKKGNIRDYATLNQLLVLANIESYDAILIEQGKRQPERLIALRDLAVRQMQTMDYLNTTRLPQMGIVKCPICGAGMYGNKNIKRKKDGTKYKDFYYYGCKHRTMTRGHKCDYKKQIREELLDDAVVEVIVKLVGNPKFAAILCCQAKAGGGN